jgi:hypothetical protein
MKLATILVIWSIRSAFDFEEESMNSIKKPHAAQIIAICLLSKGESQNGIVDSKIAQIRTGEGKSIVLTTLAIYFAR